MFDIAAHQILAEPVTAFFKGRAIAVANQEAQQNMALQAAQNQRAQEAHDMGVQAQQSAMQKDQAKTAFLSAKEVVDSEDPVATASGMTDFAKDFDSHHGEGAYQQLLSQGPDVVRKAAQAVMAHAAPIAGIDVPRKLETITGPDGQILQRDPDTNKITEAVKSNGITPYEAATLQVRKNDDAEQHRHNVEMEKAASARIDATTNPHGNLSDAAVDLAARRMLNGEQPSKILANFGRGKQGVADLAAVQNRFAQLAVESGMDEVDIATRIQELSAQGRAETELGAREGKIAPRVKEAENFAQMALTASQNVPRTNWKSLNKLIQAGETEASDPAMAKLLVANNSLVNAYAAAIGGGVIHVEDQKVGRQMLATADGPKAYEAKVQQLIAETRGALKAPGQVRDQIRDDIKNRARPGEASVKSYIHKSGAKVEILD